MNARDYFPLGKAHADAFCNRYDETNWLVDNIHACKHTLLVAPRRYGKSSLAERAIERSEYPSICLNFNSCTTEQEIADLLQRGISKLIGKALGPIEKITHLIKNYAQILTPKLNLSANGPELELSTNPGFNPAANLEEALQLIEYLLAKKKKPAVMLLDEFQAVGLIAKGSGVEAAIRNVAQDMKYLSLIFSGSNRHLLQFMFEDNKRPLYKLCRKMHFTRIEDKHYQIHLNKAAELKWHSPLDQINFEKIMLYTRKHPYYVNYLCDVIWTECLSLPSLNDINRAWNIVIDEEHSDANAEISQLSMGHKKVLKHIAKHAGKNLTSNQTSQATGMPASSIAGAIASLLEKDIIEKIDQNYEIINPVIHYILSESDWNVKS